MYTSISGIYENGKLTLLEAAPTDRKSKVIITFIEEDENLPGRRLGGLAGKVTLPDDFNAPLDDLRDYMF